jgi:UDP-glucose 4-epimerase
VSQVDAVVVGAGGFLGSALVAGLTAAGVGTAGATRMNPVIHDGAVAPAFRSATVFFYAATSVTPGTAERFPERAAADVAHFHRLLDALAELGTCPAVVLAGSGDCYADDAPLPFREDTPLRSAKVYSQGKIDMEQALAASTGVRPLVVRLASLYGPGHRTDPGHGVVAHWLTAVAEGRRLRQIGADDTTRDFVYVADVVSALRRVHRRLSDPALRPEPLPFAVNIGSGEPVSLGRLRREVAAATGRTPMVDRSPARAFDRRALLLNVDLAAKTLGWRPETSFTDGLRRTWAAIRAR